MIISGSPHRPALTHPVKRHRVLLPDGRFLHDCGLTKQKKQPSKEMSCSHVPVNPHTRHSGHHSPQMERRQPRGGGGGGQPSCVRSFGVASAATATRGRHFPHVQLGWSNNMQHNSAIPTDPWRTAQVGSVRLKQRTPQLKSCGCPLPGNMRGAEEGNTQCHHEKDQSLVLSPELRIQKTPGRRGVMKMQGNFFQHAGV